MTNLIRGFGLLLLLGLLSCGGNKRSSQPKLAVDLYVRYLADTRELIAQATFKEGDTLETAQPKAIQGGVAFQNSGMEQRTVQGQFIRYEIKRRGPFNPPFTFSYQNVQGQKESTNVNVTAIDSFYVKGQAVKTRGLTLGIRTTGFAAGETLVVLFSDKLGQSASLNFEGPFDTQELFIPGSILAALQPGALQVYLVRKSALLKDSPQSSIVAAGEYYTPAIETTLVN